MIQQILEMRKQSESFPIVKQVDDSDLIELTSAAEVAKDEPIHYIGGKYSVPRDDLFLVLHVPFLLNPFSFQIECYRTYKQWLLFPAQYVLNTFTRSRFDNLRTWILSHHFPNSTMDLHNLFMMLSEFELTVPGRFESQFIEILDSRRA